ncbi:hypothetical protein Lmor_1912 [Legionella moravica]|uniref:Uncharacterized protein n=1 Tax=Legionella moravica TaxID=39962 RepID=A0A378JRE6_9GAMM|nr:hypothetical protein [Legionella moravica]KTD33930.1 hypothetical protein Lmor_1912 [Legionella moravica]STX61173.1 Uncharacterised protein [Legionella moravica]
MNNTNEYSLALIAELKNKNLERSKIYVEVMSGDRIRYKALDNAGKEREGIITKNDAFTSLNWHLLDNNRLDTFKGGVIKSVIYSVALDRGDIPMSRNQKLRRAGLVCVYFTKNYAYYKAGFDEKILIDKNNFWITTQNNFLDMAVLEWSKLFLKPTNNKYYWTKIVRDKDNFGKKFNKFNLSYIETYRDKFVAHLDDKTIMNIPKFDSAYDLVCSLYNDIYPQLEDTHNLPENLNEYYDACLKDAIKYYPLIKQ